jgi:predicted O-linked N-acetylglucosamine transferase (SPINDLY family)
MHTSNDLRTAFDKALSLHQNGRIDAARELYEEILRTHPNHDETIHLLGVICFEKGEFAESIRLISRAIEIDPKFSAAHYNLGKCYEKLQDSEKAINSYSTSIQLEPNNAEAYFGIGNSLFDLRRYEEAVESYDKAITLRPGYADALGNRGNVLKKLKRYDEALASYDSALKLEPDQDDLLGRRMATALNMGDWSKFASDVREIETKTERLEKASSPFAMLLTSNSRQLQLKLAVICAAKFSQSARVESVVKGAGNGRIRIGYFSSDFRNHPTSHLIAEMLEHHDKGRFEVIAFSHGPNDNSQIQKRMENAFERFFHVEEMSDLDLTALARDNALDIAVNLNGYTKLARTAVFAIRVAPLQVNFLGYPGTMGAKFMDYIIADRTLIPPSHQDGYSEKIVYLPHSYQPNDRKREIAEKQFTRLELGLPARGFIFCCFNNNSKINPNSFDMWLRVLKQVDGSVLWLLSKNDYVTPNLRKEAEARGVDPSRLIFAPLIPMPEHIARHQCADLFLDTLPCNAHTTASDALWGGLPVLTLIGETFAGRVAASLLNAIGLPELITTSKIEYERMAIELARNPAKLLSIKKKLSDNRLVTPLFDAKLYAKHLEAAYAAMYERYQADLPPAHIHVNPL